MHINKSLILAHINRGVNNRCCCVQRAVQSQHAAGMGSHDLAAMAAAEKAAINSIKNWSKGQVALPADDDIHTIFVGLQISEYNFALLEDYKTAIEDPTTSLDTFSDIRTMITTVNATALDDAINLIVGIKETGGVNAISFSDLGKALVLVDWGKDTYIATNFDGYTNAIFTASSSDLNLNTSDEIQAMITAVNTAVASIESFAASSTLNADDTVDIGLALVAAGVDNYAPDNLAGYANAISYAYAASLDTFSAIQAMVTNVNAVASIVSMVSAGGAIVLDDATGLALVATGVFGTGYNADNLAGYANAISEWPAGGIFDFEDIQDVVTNVNAEISAAITLIAGFSGKTILASDQSSVVSALQLVDMGVGDYDLANFDGYKNAIENPSAGPLTSKAAIRAMINTVNNSQPY